MTIPWTKMMVPYVFNLISSFSLFESRKVVTLLIVSTAPRHMIELSEEIRKKIKD